MNDVCLKLRFVGLGGSPTPKLHSSAPPPPTSYRHITSFYVSCKCSINLCPFFNRLVVVVVLKMMLLFRQRSIQKSNRKHKRVVPSLDIPAAVWLTENHLTQPTCLQVGLTNLIISSWGYVNQQFAYT